MLEAVVQQAGMSWGFSIPYSSSFTTQSTLDTLYSLVTSESVDYQATLTANGTLAFACSMALHFDNATSIATYVGIAEAFGLDDTVTVDQEMIFAATESLIVSGVCATRLSGLVALAEALSVVSNLHGGMAHSLSEAFGVADNIALTPQFLLGALESMLIQGDSESALSVAMALLEPVIVSGDVSLTLSALVALSEALAIQATETPAISISILAELGLADSSELSRQIILAAIESAVFDDTLELTAQLYLAPSEHFAIADTVSSSALFGMAISEEIDFVGVINTPDGSYTAWVLNTETRAPWQYENFPFNSFAFTGNTYLALTDAGLYELAGDTDDGANISATIKTGLMNFGSNLQKNIPRGYFGYSTSGTLVFKTISTDRGQKIERWYTLEERTADDTTETRVKLARGVKSVYWQFELTNVDGADFDLDEITLTPAILNRRI